MKVGASEQAGGRHMATTYNTLGQVVINGRTHWEQLEYQQERAENLARENAAYIRLNNLYLNIQAGRQALTITTANELRCLAVIAYPGVSLFNNLLQDWWAGEFEKLPGWFDV